jgi:hypothetical protein
MTYQPFQACKNFATEAVLNIEGRMQTSMFNYGYSELIFFWVKPLQVVSLGSESFGVNGIGHI